MELRHLRTFRAVAGTLNFTRAAHELHYAQSSVTEQVQVLETELGVALFDRTGRKLGLTVAGQRLVEYADQILTLAEQARTVAEDSANEPAGELVIGALETLCATQIPPVLTNYRNRCPQVRVTVRQANRGELYNAVRRGELDLCFTFGAAPADPVLSSEILAVQRLLIVAPIGHRLTKLDHVTVRDLREEPFLVTEAGCGFRDMFDRSLGLLGADGPRIEAEVNSIAALCTCVASGMGCALLPESAVESHLDRGTVAALRLEDLEYETTVTATWLRRWEHKPSVVTFLNTARSTLA
ncbi:MAG: LysR family transcriptional regulator [Acidimicrobiales bacterium]|nr:MAG: LysR family transcriptional regulator [Acidimicrobiales bacterium]